MNRLGRWYYNEKRGGKQMPTINQLVRKGRVSKIKKSKSPALNKGFNASKSPKLTLLLRKNVEFVLVLVL